ncbi:MAG: HD domain-containing phosphohydrolase [Gaiellales bacterium]
MPPLDHRLDSFDLRDARGGAVTLDELVSSGPVVLAAVEGGGSPDPRLAMLRELGRGASEYGSRLVVVSDGDCPAGRQLEAARIAGWLRDAGNAFRALGLTERKLGRTRRRSGVFVVDAGRTLRFAFSSREPAEWIPASVVLSRLRRLAASASPCAPESVAEPAAEEPAVPPAEAAMDALVRGVGRQLGMGPDEVSELATASRFRDLGMAMVPNSIVTKDGPLSADEWDVVKQHPLRSAEMLGDGATLDRVREVIRASHEHLDGTGYPRGLRGDQIPMGSRILLAAEAYLAMSQERPYRELLGLADAASELRTYTGTLYDPVVVDALLAVLAESD